MFFCVTFAFRTFCLYLNFYVCFKKFHRNLHLNGCYWILGTSNGYLFEEYVCFTFSVISWWVVRGRGVHNILDLIPARPNYKFKHILKTFLTSHAYLMDSIGMHLEIMSLIHSRYYYLGARLFLLQVTHKWIIQLIGYHETRNISIFCLKINFICT